MIVEELTKKANDLVQNVYIQLQNAITAASSGVDYSESWEKAMQSQIELLRTINDLKYKQSSKRTNVN